MEVLAEKRLDVVGMQCDWLIINTPATTSVISGMSNTSLSFVASCARLLSRTVATLVARANFTRGELVCSLAERADATSRGVEGGIILALAFGEAWGIDSSKSSSSPYSSSSLGWFA